MHPFYSPSIVWKDKILIPCSELLILSPFAIKGNHLDTENQLKLEKEVQSLNLIFSKKKNICV